MNEVININMELNTLNEIIRKKNITIQEFRDLTDKNGKKLKNYLKIMIIYQKIIKY